MKIGALETPFSADTWGGFCWIAEGAKQYNPGWRWGQAWFSTLEAFHPELADIIRGTELDPYHDDSKLDAFCEALVEWFK